jgi:hypothetical protein
MNIYSKFAQYYIEMLDEFRGLLADVHEYNESHEEIPQELKNEYGRHMLIVELLEREGKEKFNKSREELYRDGWDFWFKEDAELREKRYGKK